MGIGEIYERRAVLMLDSGFSRLWVSTSSSSSYRGGGADTIVAACDRVCSMLGWQPRFDDLQNIVAHALGMGVQAFDPRRLTCNHLGLG